MAITIVRHLSFNGPNVWSRNPVITLWLRVDNRFEVDLAQVNPSLSGCIAELAEIETSHTRYELLPIDRVAGFDAVLAIFILNLQRLAGFPVDARYVSSVSEAGAFQITVEHPHETVGLAASRLAVRLSNHLVFGTEPTFDVLTEFNLRFGAIAGSRRYGRAAESIVAAARARKIPISHLDLSAKLIEFGTGAYRQRIHGSITSRTPSIGATIASDKQLTNHYLRAAGLPVARGKVVRRIDLAVETAREIGYPVVLKPINQGGSTAVFLDIRSDDQVRECFPEVAAATRSGSVLIEENRMENEYRILIVNDQLIAASLRIPAHVIGDGVSTIEKLVEIENRDPRRGKRESLPLEKIDIDSELFSYLARSFRTLGDVPAVGERVQLRLSADINTGGFSIDKTDDVHPDNVAIFRQATALFGLDIASIDVVASDISRSIRATSGAILDINVGSGFIFERYPGEGTPRDPGPAINDMLYPVGSRVRAPIVAVSGEFSTEICSFVARLFEAFGERVSSSTREGIVIDRTRILTGNSANPNGFGIALNNPSTEFMVAEIDPSILTDQGLGFSYCDVAMVTSVAGINTPLGDPIERVFTGLCDPSGYLILNADRSEVVKLMRGVETNVLLYSQNGKTACVAEHLARGGRALIGTRTPNGEAISYLLGEETAHTISIEGGYSAAGERARLESGVMLPALAAALVHEIPIETIRQAVLQRIGEWDTRSV